MEAYSREVAEADHPKKEGWSVIQKFQKSDFDAEFDTYSQAQNFKDEHDKEVVAKDWGWAYGWNGKVETSTNKFVVLDLDT